MSVTGAPPLPAALRLACFPSSRRARGCRRRSPRPRAAPRARRRAASGGAAPARGAAGSRCTHRARRDERPLRVGRRQLGEALPQLRRELVHRVEAARRILLERALDRRGEPQRARRAASRAVRRRLVDVLHRDGDEVLARERHLAGQQLVEHDAERVDVGRRRRSACRSPARARGSCSSRAPCPVCVTPCSTSSERAMPKSVTFASPSGVSSTFCGFTSRCTSPCSCANASASAICERELDRAPRRAAGRCARRAASGSRRRRTRRR